MIFVEPVVKDNKQIQIGHEEIGIISLGVFFVPIIGPMAQSKCQLLEMKLLQVRMDWIICGMCCCKSNFSQYSCG